MMKLNDNVTRLISAKASQVSTYNGRQLKEAIFKSEGRVLMGQTYLKNPILFINSIAMFLAMLSINTTCIWVHYQPKVPGGLRLKNKENEK